MATIAIIGSREFRDPGYYIDYTLDRLTPNDTVISGGARNVDQKAEAAARSRRLTVESYRPRKASHGVFVIERFVDERSAGLVGNPQPLTFPTFREAAFRRNWLIAGAAIDGVTAIWDGYSTGTAFGIACAARWNRPLTIWLPGDS